jgi:hypothetical protein
MRFCFLAAITAADGVRAAALVTDQRTRPVEFRVTEPLSIGSLQRVLYGASLDDEMLGELCAQPLLSALRESFDCVLVREQGLLGLQSLLEVPVIWIGRDESSDESAASGKVVMGYHGVRDSDALARVREVLRQVADHHDLLEPFERIDGALTELRRELPLTR